MKRYSALIYFLIFFVISYGSIFPQSALRSGIKFGMDFKDYLSNGNGSFVKEPDYEVGLFTGIKLFSKEKNALFLKLELNYVKLIRYKLRQLYHTGSWNNGSWSFNDVIEDERFYFPFVELGIIPEYFIMLNDDNLLSFMIGPSIGFGSRSVAVNVISGTWTYDYFDEYGMGFILPISFKAGINLYYKIFFAGVRYRYTYLGDSHVDGINEISLVGGFAFK